MGLPVPWHSPPLGATGWEAEGSRAAAGAQRTPPGWGIDRGGAPGHPTCALGAQLTPGLQLEP